MEDNVLGRGNKTDSKPLILKLGFALALSLATYIASQVTFKPRISRPKSPSGDPGSEKFMVKSSKVAAASIRDELNILSSEEAFAKIINGTSSPSSTTTTIMNEDGTYNDITDQEVETILENNKVDAVNKEVVFEEREEMEKEITYLKNMVESLKERERHLELQMIEYHDLKEQNASLRELENRLKVNVMDRKMLTLKIESLQTDNQKLKSLVSDYPKIVSELESAREEIKALKHKLKLDGEEAKEKLALLHASITEMINRERKVEKEGVENEMKLKRLKKLEEEVTDLRMVNSRLAKENLKFAEMLETMKEPSPQEVMALKMNTHLREENDNLKKQIEQLQTDRCTDVEELVYLRWVNACLRYELRNYQPAQGKVAARDLSKCLSPESEKKAKKLILDYAKSDTNSKNIDHFDFEIESCSSSQTSSDDYSETSFDVTSSTKSTNSRKSKVISKLKKLVLGKSKNNGSKISSLEDMNERRRSYDNVASCISVEKASINNVGNSPSSINEKIKEYNNEVSERLVERCRSDLGMSRGHMRMISEDGSSDMSQNDNLDVPEKAKIKKFADVLKGSVKAKRRLPSFS